MNNYFDLQQHLDTVYARFPEADRQPVIGITGNYDNLTCKLGQGYYKSVVAAGGVPVIIPPVADTDTIVNTLERIDVISRALNPYSQNDAFMALADQPEIRFVISNTTEAGIAFDPACKLDDKPASSYPGKLVQLLYRRYQTFGGDRSKGLIIFPCELIFLNGHVLKDCIYKYIELWNS